MFCTYFKFNKFNIIPRNIARSTLLCRKAEGLFITRNVTCCRSFQVAKSSDHQQGLNNKNACHLFAGDHSLGPKNDHSKGNDLRNGHSLRIHLLWFSLLSLFW